MVVDRQKVKTRSESWRYRVAARFVVKAGRLVRQAGAKSRNRQGSKPGGLEKDECKKKTRRTGKPLVDLETYKTNWHRETGNTGINTLRKISNTWRGWRQSQGQVKQIRACLFVNLSI